MALEVGSLYIVLFHRGSENDYHWGLYYYWSPERGTKFHVRNPYANYWIMDVRETSNATGSYLLVGFVKIAQIDVAHRSTLESHVSSVPLVSPSESIPFTCRIWVVEAIKKLIGLGIVKCRAGTQALEAEAHAFANSEWSKANDNVQPRPVITSVHCIFN